MKKILIPALILPLALLLASETGWIVRDVNFYGNSSYSKKRLLKSMVSRPSGLFKKYSYHAHLLRGDLESVRQFYTANGYLDAEISLQHVTRDSLEKQVTIDIRINEGSRTLVKSVQVTGSRVLAEKKLRPHIKISPGDPLKKNALSVSQQNLLNAYAEEGFIDAAVTADIVLDTLEHAAFIKFQITEGEQYVIGDIRITGLRKTKPDLVRRVLTFKTGEKVRYSRLLRSQRLLYLTGLFERVSIGLDSLREAGAVNVNVQEAELKDISLLGGYGSDDKLRARIEYNNRNLGGTGRRFGTKLKASYIQRNIETSFTDPWLLNTAVTVDAGASYRWQKEPGFTFQRLGGKIIFSSKIHRNLQAAVEGRLDWTDYLAVSIADQGGTRPNRIKGIKLAATLNTRDNLYNPGKGCYVGLDGEFGRVFSSGDHTFTRLQLDCRLFFQAGILGTVGTAAEIGWMSMAGGIDRIPLEERYFAGGANSVRGFRYRRLGPRDHKGTPIGGSVKLVCHLVEIRKPVWRSLGASAFVDMGQVWRDRRHAGLENIRWTAGLGVRLITPIGVIRLEYGHLLNREAAEPPGGLMLNIGNTF